MISISTVFTDHCQNGPLSVSSEQPPQLRLLPLYMGDTRLNPEDQKIPMCPASTTNTFLLDLTGTINKQYLKNISYQDCFLGKRV